MVTELDCFFFVYGRTLGDYVVDGCWLGREVFFACLSSFFVRKWPVRSRERVVKIFNSKNAWNRNRLFTVYIFR